MQRLPLIRVLCLLALAALPCSCSRESEAPPSPEPLAFPLPEGWPATRYNFSTNPLTREGFELGRQLFYDGLLSKDGNFPCASCHQPAAAFGTFDHDLSHGFNDQHTLRNAPPLFNLAWHLEMHHDGGISSLDLQPLAPLTAPNEMAETIPNVLQKLNADPDYKKQFRTVFGTEEITTERLTKALSQFMLMLVSAGSKYDRVMAAKDRFNVNEEAGYAIFQQKCSSCHTEPLFTDLQYRNNGLPVNPDLLDYGRMRITVNSADSLKFKVPSLRNIAVSYPYMHDGRFNDLANVLEHYNSGVVDGPTTDPLVKNKIPLSATEKGLLTEFLKTLTDSSYLYNPAFQEKR